jgi:cytochrome c553
MNAKLIATFFALSSLYAVGVAQAEGNATAGQAKAATCAACHGVDGNSSNPEWPSLAGQHASYIDKQVHAFKSGVRQSPIMMPMVANLSDPDIADIAAYFESQTARGGEADKSRVALGQKLYRGGNGKTQVPACLACHGPTGRGNPASMYPSIRGQHATYLIAQLNAYKKGDRKTDATKAMNDIAGRLSEDEIAAVTSYVQGLR